MKTLKDAVCPPRAAEINHHKLVTTDCFPLLSVPEVQRKSFLVALMVDLCQHTPSFCLCLHMAFSSSQFCLHGPENPPRGCRMTLSQYGQRIFPSYTFEKGVISRIYKEKKGVKETNDLTKEIDYWSKEFSIKLIKMAKKYLKKQPSSLPISTCKLKQLESSSRPTQKSMKQWINNAYEFVEKGGPPQPLLVGCRLMHPLWNISKKWKLNLHH